MGLIREIILAHFTMTPLTSQIAAQCAFAKRHFDGPDYRFYDFCHLCGQFTFNKETLDMIQVTKILVMCIMCMSLQVEVPNCSLLCHCCPNGHSATISRVRNDTFYSV